tara:strand:- start:1505 stop:2152 length:648 start_codon:yes stop_codon:yes gene_type:complete
MENKFVPTQIPNFVPGWGPFLWKSELLSSIIDELLKRTNAIKNNSEDKLSSFNENNIMLNSWSYPITEGDREWFQEILNPWIQTYLKSFSQFNDDTYNPMRYFINQLWVNYQKQYNFNPPHSHNGNLSFVVYLNIPKEMYDEEWKSNEPKPGSITFRYGERAPMLDNKRTFVPKTGDIFIFPSWLEHMVVPFKTESVERVSVSGNIYFQNSNNNV